MNHKKEFKKHQFKRQYCFNCHTEMFGYKRKYCGECKELMYKRKVHEYYINNRIKNDS